jgi:drug/metabolite transporter (DMT)-like permease
MLTILAGLALALGSATMYGLAVVLQAGEARLLPQAAGLRLALAWRLAARPRWLAGAALGVVGWPLQATALLLAPLIVVQPALAFALVVLLAAARRMLAEPVRRREWVAVGGIIGGVALLAASAPARAPLAGGAGQVAPVIVGLALVAATPIVVRRRIVRHGRLVAIGAGAGYATAGLVTKLLADAATARSWLLAGGLLVGVGLISGVGALSEMTAYQTAPATSVAPIIFVIEVVVPTLTVIIVSGEHPSGVTAGVLVVVALGMLTASVTVLARSDRVASLVATAAQTSAG